MATGFINSNKKEASGYYLSGIAYQAEGKLRKSIARFEKALEIQPTAIEPLTQLVKSHLALKEKDRVLKKLQKISNKQPQHLAAFNLMGDVYLSEKQYKKAEQAYLKAVKLKPEWSVPYQRLAVLNLAREKNKLPLTIIATALRKLMAILYWLRDWL